MKAIAIVSIAPPPLSPMDLSVEARRSEARCALLTECSERWWGGSLKRRRLRPDWPFQRLETVERGL
jgi:hypothetical protein